MAHQYHFLLVSSSLYTYFFISLRQTFFVFQIIQKAFQIKKHLMSGIIFLYVINWCIYSLLNYFLCILILKVLTIICMLTFFRCFCKFWSTMWKFVTPSLLVLILGVTFFKYEPTTYGKYNFPDWANILGWHVTAASIAFIPIVAFYKIFKHGGSSNLLLVGGFSQLAVAKMLNLACFSGFSHFVFVRYNCLPEY